MCVVIYLQPIYFLEQNASYNQVLINDTLSYAQFTLLSFQGIAAENGRICSYNSKICSGKLSCQGPKLIMVQKVSFFNTSNTNRTCHVCSSWEGGNRFNDTSEFTSLLYERCSLSSSCNVINWQLLTAGSGTWLVDVVYSCIVKGLLDL